MTIKSIETEPFADQKPGTSGLRKQVRVFQKPHDLENFVQATVDAGHFQGRALVVGGDGTRNDSGLTGPGGAAAVGRSELRDVCS